MKDNCILTAESVTEGHPDKLCDTIADSVLDACLKHDPAARVACEVMATAGKIIVAGEITAKDLPDIPAIVCQTVRETGYGGSDYEVEAVTHDQSGDIAGAVDGSNMGSPRKPSAAGCVGKGGARERTQFSPQAGTELSGLCADAGAGDQGIMYGYACNETAELLPLPVVLAHRLTLLLTNTRRMGIIQGLGPDGKAQVSVEYQGGAPRRIAAVVVSCQHDADKETDELRREIIRRVIVPALRDLPPDPNTEVFVNHSGRFVLGGFEADTGLTGRKLMADTYGGLAPHGGGALSGKDGSKVDRSGAYMARYIAKNLVAAGLAEHCTVSLAYAIGRAEPVAVDIDAHQTGKYPEAVLERAVRAVFDLTPAGMISALGLDRPIFARFCNYGHFTHQDAPWEQCDRTEALSESCQMAAAGAFTR